MLCPPKQAWDSIDCVTVIAGAQHQTGRQLQPAPSNADAGGYSGMPDQQASDPSNMAGASQGQFGMPRNNFLPYINPYQSFPNPMGMQVGSSIALLVSE